MLDETLSQLRELEVSGWGGESDRWWHEEMSNRSVSCGDECPGRRTAAHWLSAPAAHLQSGQTVMQGLMETVRGSVPDAFPHKSNTRYRTCENSRSPRQMLNDKVWGFFAVVSFEYSDKNTKRIIWNIKYEQNVMNNSKLSFFKDLITVYNCLHQ